MTNTSNVNQAHRPLWQPGALQLVIGRAPCALTCGSCEGVIEAGEMCTRDLVEHRDFCLRCPEQHS